MPAHIRDDDPRIGSTDDAQTGAFDGEIVIPVAPL
jgi:hypothetical protein